MESGQDVFVIGAGQSEVLKTANLSIEELGALAIKEAISQAQFPTVEAVYIGNMLAGAVSHQQQLGTLLIHQAGLTGLEALTAEAACASGAAALHLGVLAIKSGLYDCVVVCGVEKMSSITDKEQIATNLATALDWESEGAKGVTVASLNAKLMQVYMNSYGLSSEIFAPFSINAHQNALTNPKALFHKAITQQDYSNSKIVEYPLRLYDACPVCDGAAALVLASRSVVSGLPLNHPKVLIRASTVATDTHRFKDRESFSTLKAVEKSSYLAYKQAKLDPHEIDIFELHDAYSIIAILSLEAAGFTKPGRGFELGLSGDIYLDGKIPIATFGGLKARGHPIGATGIYQCVELFLQLTGQARENQVKEPSIGMCQSIGGVGSTVITHILEAA